MKKEIKYKIIIKQFTITEYKIKEEGTKHNGNKPVYALKRWRRDVS